MVILLLAAFFATINAIVAGYYLVQGITTGKDDASRSGSFIFSGVAGGTALFLFIIAALNA